MKPNPVYRRLKSGLDILATMVAAALGVFLLFRLVFPAAATSDGLRPNPMLPLPSAPIPIEDSATEGADSARVVVVVFSDFLCPYCGEFAREVLPEIRTEMIETGIAQLVFKHFPLETIHPRARALGQAAECARRQGGFVPMHDRLFSLRPERQALDPKEAGLSIGVDLDAFEGCLAGTSAAAAVQRDIDLGKSLGVAGTPTFFIGLRDPAGGGVRASASFVGNKPTAALMGAVEAALRSGTS